jgi:PAS domain S-box-containing protein
MRILLIDDSAAYREEFASILADSQIKYSALDHATNFAEGARLITTGVHDVYFVDFRLPGGSGLDLVRDARTRGVTKPIIVLTAFGNPLIDDAAEEAGASDYLAKGEFTPQLLNRAIRYAVRNAAAVTAARAAESRFRMAQEIAGIGTWDYDLRTNTIAWSKQMQVLYGFDGDSREPVLFDTWRQAVHADDRDIAQALIADCVNGRGSYNARFRILRLDPAHPDVPPVVRWIAAKGELVRDACGTPERLIGVNIDITDQQAVVTALHDSRDVALANQRASEARFRTYFDNSPDCLFHFRRTTDDRFVYEAINPVGLAHAGQTLEQVLGRTPEEVLGVATGAIVTEKFRQVCETGMEYRYEPTFPMADGLVVFEAVYSPLRNEAGDIVGVLGSARDITERRKLEQSLHQAQKMEALGQLAGGVAHDFNNLLTGIQGCFELLDRHVSSPAGKRLLTQGTRAVQRSTALTSRLLAFSRHQPLATQRVDLNASLNEMSEMLARTLGSDMRIGVRGAPDLLPAFTDRNQIELAILNLAINARDAMPMGGSLTIETRNETVPEPRNGMQPGDYVVIVVTDTGTGMPPEVLSRVLEPFFTTKPSGKGTGLGLSMVAGIVRQLGGALDIASQVAKGTCVSLYLPRAATEPATATRRRACASCLSMMTRTSRRSFRNTPRRPVIPSK